jgi:Mn2+/Fe2+ NRAMP family transporter
MNKILDVVLGIVTSIGGYLEIGSLTTAAQSGAAYGTQLIWAVVLGTICIILLVEMAGRFSAVSKHTITDAIRERFGFKFFLWPLVIVILVNTLTLAAEIGGISIALEFATGISYRWWAVPAAIGMWLLIWNGKFGLLENGISIVGLVTLCFVVAAVVIHPDWGRVAAGAVPTLPDHQPAHYWFLVVSILGATIMPSLYLFYSSGAIEDRWDESYVMANRVIASFGMLFGAAISIGVVIVATVVMRGHGITEISDYHQLPLLLTQVFGLWGFALVAASIAIACIGAVFEISLAQAYLVAQGFGWNWGEDLKPKDDPAFALVYTVSLLASAIPIALGLDPLQVTVFAMALTSASLPFTVVPFLLLMNDKNYVKEHTNHLAANIAVGLIIVLAFVLAVVTIPLQIMGS